MLGRTWRSVLIGFLAVFSLATVIPAAAQEESNLKPCLLGAFSTEEDFMGTDVTGALIYISDGDLLSVTGEVCARNADLVERFDVNYDLGLDALDVFDFSALPTDFGEIIVAFSTELDSPHGNFSAGDLLFNSGHSIPNAALVLPFQIPYDIGLDGVHFVGEPELIRRFYEIVMGSSPEDWLDGRLQSFLRELDIDIWFSIEGTWPFTERQQILDGDILSARDGVVVLSQDQMYNDPAVPAGIPKRGVDFGLDGLTGPREPERDKLLFSSEILHEGELTFTDGDVLEFGGLVMVDNASLIAPFNPQAKFLGLDALSLTNGEAPRDPNIQSMCGQDAVQFDGGTVLPGGGGTGLFRDNPDAAFPAGRPRRPCGDFAPIDAYLPTTGIKRFRVAYRPAGDPIPPVNSAPGIETKWKLKEWRWFPFPGCYTSMMTLETSNGWMDYANFQAAVNGTLTGCAHPQFRTAVWDTANARGLGPADANGHYVLWMEWETSGGSLQKEAFEHHLQLDNRNPLITDFKVFLEGTEVEVAACGEAPEGSSRFDIYADFEDDHFWFYELIVKGGVPPLSHSFGQFGYYTPGLGVQFFNIDDTGTTPDNTMVHIQTIDMTEMGESFVDCCYLIELYVWDATIRHNFTDFASNPTSYRYAYSFKTFAAAP